MKTRYKFLKLVDGKIKSNSGDVTWKIGEWKQEDKIKACEYGFHCSKEIWEAFSYIKGEILAEVEVKGDSDTSESDKEVYTDMRIVRAWKWQKKDSVALSIYAAELCIENYEKVYPNDKRPRKAIEAAKKWLLDPSQKNKSATEAARSAEEAAWSAEEAWSAALTLAARSAALTLAAWSAEEAAWSAESAARSAEEAAESAARSAEEAAWSAESAAWSAARSAEEAESAAWSAAKTKKKIFTLICKWFDERLNELEIYE